MTPGAVSAPTRVRHAVVPFRAGDGKELNLIHATGDLPPTRGPVLLVHGAGVRANIFEPPEPANLVTTLVDDGWDVWLENWRASIDLPPTEWDLDQAAVLDHPQAVAAVRHHTGADTVKAIVHCQGSTSFVLSAAAGLLPHVDTIVSNAVSFHPVVSAPSRVKLLVVAPLLAPRLPYFDPQWGLDPPDDWLPRRLIDFVRVTHHECDNIVCRLVSFTYGTGFPCLWSHANLSAATHDWLAGEFAAVPLRFFRQMGRSVRAGQLTSTHQFAELPAHIAAQPPRTDARFVLMAGEDNRCFAAESQVRTFAHLDSLAPGRHALHTFAGYGHLDVFLGRDAHHDIFPTILEELRR